MSLQMSTYTVEMILRGYHVYLVIWEAAVGQVWPYLLRSEVFICSVLGCRCPGVFPSGCLFHLNYDTQRRNNRQKVTIVLEQEHQRRDDALSTHVPKNLMPAAYYGIPCCVPHPSLRVQCSQKNLQRKLLWHCTNLQNSWKFSPSKVSCYMVSWPYLIPLLYLGFLSVFMTLVIHGCTSQNWVLVWSVAHNFAQHLHRTKKISPLKSLLVKDFNRRSAKQTYHLFGPSMVFVWFTRTIHRTSVPKCIGTLMTLPVGGKPPWSSTMSTPHWMAV